jgi:excisionase family DNA binding protein
MATVATRPTAQAFTPSGAGSPLSCNQVADYLGISLPTIYGMMDRGEIRGVRAGRRRLIPVSAVEEYLGEPYRPGTQDAPRIEQPERGLAADRWAPGNPMHGPVTRLSVATFPISMAPRWTESPWGHFVSPGPVGTRLGQCGEQSNTPTPADISPNKRQTTDQRISDRLLSSCL